VLGLFVSDMSARLELECRVLDVEVLPDARLQLIE
jgi:hypothetical protein